MTMRIETAFEGPTVTFRLIGRIRSEHLDALTTHMRGCQGTIVLDLDEVTLVDLQVVRFLGAAERAGVGLRNCPPFVREWISREREE
jgi:hypothetical protein